MKKKVSFNEIPEALDALLVLTAQILTATQSKPTNPANNHLKEILSVKEVCELLDINRTTLWNWEKKGTVKSYGIEGRKFFKRSDLLKLLIPLTDGK